MSIDLRGWTVSWPTEPGWYWFCRVSRGDVKKHGKWNEVFKCVEQASFHLGPAEMSMAGSADNRFPMWSGISQFLHPQEYMGFWIRIGGQPPETPVDFLGLDAAVAYLRPSL